MSDSRISAQPKESVSPAVTGSANGRVQTPYDQTVSSKTPPSKAEIEARLQLASESITTRVQAIQDEFSLTSEVVRSFFGSPLIGVLAVLGAGVLVGRLFGGSSGKGSRPGDPDALASLLSREVEAALEHGESPEDAIHQVVDTLGIVADGGSSKASGSTLKWIAGMALRSVLSQGIKAVSSARTDPSDAEAPPSEGLE